jgi:hypothetical protein
VWVLLLIAPGSRADDAGRPVVAADREQAGSDASTTSAPSTTVEPSTTVVASTIVSPTVAPGPTVAPTTAKAGPPVTTAPRVFSVRELVGVNIDRGTTWIAIATVTIVDQTGFPFAGVEVKATWSLDNTAASCRTDSSGKCSMYRSGVPAHVDSVTITITAPQTAAKTIRREGVN